jgi:universal stress protein A
MTQVKRILVPADFSPPSDLATDYAIDMAQRYGASIRLIHVIDDTSLLALYPDSYVDLAGLRESLANDARARLAPLMRKCAAAKVEVTGHVLNGRPAHAIVADAAEGEVDLIVMGTHGRSGFAHLFLGSVAERVVRSSPCPVLTVRESSRVQTVRAANAGAQASTTASARELMGALLS